MNATDSEPMEVEQAELEPPKKRSKKSKKTDTDESDAVVSSPEVPAHPTDEVMVDADTSVPVEAPTRRATDLLKLQLKRHEDKKAKNQLKKVEKRARDVEAGLVEKPKRVRTKAKKVTVSYESVEPSHKAWRKSFPKALRKNTEEDESTRESEAVAFLNLACPAGIPEGMPSSGPEAVIQAKLLQTDLIGCKLYVKESKTNTSLLNKGGIVTQETLGTFKVVTKDSVVQVLPKKATVFGFSLPLDSTTGKISKSLDAADETAFLLFGDALVFRSSDGSAVKWKAGSGSAGAEMVTIRIKEKKERKEREGKKPKRAVAEAEPLKAAEEADE
ncbi:ribonuclease P protein subunit POP4, partial [Phenoliferia sp. Uapishka_3]